jgi:hypothetical protein
LPDEDNPCYFSTRKNNKVVNNPLEGDYMPPKAKPDHIGWDELPPLLKDVSPATQARVIAFATANFGVPYYKSRGDAIRGLEIIGRDPKRRKEVIDLLRKGLETALWHGKKKPGGKENIDANPIGIGAAAVALGKLDAREAEPDLLEIFRFVGIDSEAHYELKQVAGLISLALVALGSKATSDIETVFKEFDETWGANSDFVNLLRYAYWVSRKDAEGALAWLADIQNKNGRIHAAAAIADLNAKALTSKLEALYDQQDGKNARKAVKIAVERLKNQKDVPPTADRMIWGLSYWHELEPAGEMSEHFPTLLDGDERPDAFTAKNPNEADRRIIATEIFDAIASGNPQRVEALLPRIPAVSDLRDQYENTIIHAAVDIHYWEAHTLKIVLAVIAVAPDVNAINEHGDTPLHLAAVRDPEVVKALLAKGARTDIKNDDGETPLKCAQDGLKTKGLENMQKPIKACIELLKKK